MIFRFLTLLAVTCFASSAFAQDAPKPSKELRVLRQSVGVWDAKMTITMPGQDPITETGVETNRMIGGFVITDYKGEFMGEKFSGHGQMGYDADEKKFVGTWLDSSDPYMSHMKGEWDAKTKTMTSMSTGKDVETGKPRTFKMVTVHKDRDNHTMTMLMDFGDGKYTEFVKIEYKRRPRGKRGAKKDTEKKPAAKKETDK